MHLTNVHSGHFNLCHFPIGHTFINSIQYGTVLISFYVHFLLSLIFIRRILFNTTFPIYWFCSRRYGHFSLHNCVENAQVTFVSILIYGRKFWIQWSSFKWSARSLKILQWRKRKIDANYGSETQAKARKYKWINIGSTKKSIVKIWKRSIQ